MSEIDITETGNIDGRNSELTTLSILKNPLAATVTRVLMDSASDLPALTAQILTDVETIHYACWIMMSHGKHDYVTFFSNFSGSFEKYIDDFASVLALSLGLTAIWGHTVGWPGTEPVDDLKAFVRGTTYRADLYYCAYPEATVRDVTKGLKSIPTVEQFLTLA